MFSFKQTTEWFSCLQEVYSIYQESGNTTKIKRRDNAQKGTLQARV